MFASSSFFSELVQTRSRSDGQTSSSNDERPSVTRDYDVSSSWPSTHKTDYFCSSLIHNIHIHNIYLWYVAPATYDRERRHTHSISTSNKPKHQAMPKSKVAKRKAPESTGEVWTAEHHLIQAEKRKKKLSLEKLQKRQERTALLTRDTQEKRDQAKLKLHITQTKRKLEKLKQRLETWDDVAEKELQRQEEERLRKEKEARNKPKERYRRPGPETWKLKGAARPAWQVYDFDTRYVDPHIKAHEEAKLKAQRSRNILALFKGRLGEENNPSIPQPFAREYLSLLMQLGLLHLQAKQFKSARSALIECMEYDSQDQPITPARCHLMRLYMEANRPDSARRLWEKLPEADSSVWIRYSAALVEFVSWNILNEPESTRETAEAQLAKAIKANVFCAYYLAFWETFNEAMDYTDDIEDAHEGSPLEEAIEYANSEQYGAWQGTDGALEWLREVVLKAIQGLPVANGNLKPADLEWRQKLSELQIESFESQVDDKEEGASQSNADDADNDDDDDDDDSVVEEGSTAEAELEPVPDTDMFRGMFETAMEMLEEAGEFQKINRNE